ADRMRSSLFRRWMRLPSPSRPSLRFRPWVEPLEDRFLLSHTPLAPEFIVNTKPVAGLFAPPAVATASDATGDFVVAWTSQLPTPGNPFQVLAQRFNRDGMAQGSELLVSAPLIAAPSSGSGTVTVDVSMDAA